MSKPTKTYQRSYIGQGTDQWEISGKEEAHGAIRRAREPPKSGVVEIIDAGYPGLAFRMSYGGQKSWQFLYTWHGKSKRLALGAYPDVKLEAARDAWRAPRKAVRQKRLPSTEPQVTPAAGDTFGTVLVSGQAGNRSRARFRGWSRRRPLSIGGTGRSGT
jgi:Arm DNA-binding domain